MAFNDILSNLEQLRLSDLPSSPHRRQLGSPEVNSSLGSYCLKLLYYLYVSIYGEHPPRFQQVDPNDIVAGVQCILEGTINHTGDKRLLSLSGSDFLSPKCVPSAYLILQSLRAEIRDPVTLGTYGEIRKFLQSVVSPHRPQDQKRSHSRPLRPDSNIARDAQLWVEISRHNVMRNISPERIKPVKPFVAGSLAPQYKSDSEERLMPLPRATSFYWSPDNHQKRQDITNSPRRPLTSSNSRIDHNESGTMISDRQRSQLTSPNSQYGEELDSTTTMSQEAKLKARPPIDRPHTTSRSHSSIVSDNHVAGSLDSAKRSINMATKPSYRSLSREFEAAGQHVAIASSPIDRASNSRSHLANGSYSARKVVIPVAVAGASIDSNESPIKGFNNNNISAIDFEVSELSASICIEPLEILSNELWACKPTNVPSDTMASAGDFYCRYTDDKGKGLPVRRLDRSVDHWQVQSMSIAPIDKHIGQSLSSEPSKGADMVYSFPIHQSGNLNMPCNPTTTTPQDMYISPGHPVQPTQRPDSKRVLGQTVLQCYQSIKWRNLLLFHANKDRQALRDHQKQKHLLANDFMRFHNGHSSAFSSPLVQLSANTRSFPTANGGQARFPGLAGYRVLTYGITNQYSRVTSNHPLQCIYCKSKQEVDIIISIEQCGYCDCHGHQPDFASHWEGTVQAARDTLQFLESATKAIALVNRVLLIRYDVSQDTSTRFPSEASSTLSSVRSVSSLANAKKPKCRHGAFEIYVAVNSAASRHNPDDQSTFVPELLFSKLASRAWPTQALLEERLVKYLAKRSIIRQEMLQPGTDDGSQDEQERFTANFATETMTVLGDELLRDQDGKIVLQSLTFNDILVVQSPGVHIHEAWCHSYPSVTLGDRVIVVNRQIAANGVPYMDRAGLVGVVTGVDLFRKEISVRLLYHEEDIFVPESCCIKVDDQDPRKASRSLELGSRHPSGLPLSLDLLLILSTGFADRPLEVIWGTSASALRSTVFHTIRSLCQAIETSDIPRKFGITLERHTQLARFARMTSTTSKGNDGNSVTYWHPLAHEEVDLQEAYSEGVLDWIFSNLASEAGGILVDKEDLYSASLWANDNVLLHYFARRQIVDGMCDDVDKLVDDASDDDDNDEKEEDVNARPAEATTTRPGSAARTNVVTSKKNIRLKSTKGLDKPRNPAKKSSKPIKTKH